MNPSLQSRLIVFRDRLQTNSELQEFYEQEVKAMEMQLHQEGSVFSLIKRNFIARREWKELYTQDLSEYLAVIRTHEVVEACDRWSWRYWDMVHYVRYK